MTTIRFPIGDFQLANPLYAAAQASFFTVDSSGHATTTLATLYADPTSAVTAANPQTLDAVGKFVAPVYIAQPVIASVTGPNVASHSTGVIDARGTWKGNWATATLYFSTDFLADSVTGNVYIAASDFTSSASIATDIAAGNLVLVVDKSVVNAAANNAIKAPARTATTAAITLSGLQTVDGVALASGDRVLVKNQAAQATNGTYNAAVGAWVRTSDFNASAQLAAGALVFVNSGTLNGQTIWALSDTDPVVLGATALTFVQQAVMVGSAPITGGSSTATSYGLLYNKNGTLGDTATSPGQPITLNGGPLVLNASGAPMSSWASAPSTYFGRAPNLILSAAEDSGTQGEAILLFDTYGANAQGTLLFAKSGGGGVFTGSVAGTTLTISSVQFGSLAVNQVVMVAGVPAGTTISGLGTGSGGAGTYTLSAPGTVAGGTSILTNDSPLHPSAVINNELLGAIICAGWYGSPATRTFQTAGIEFNSNGGDWSSTSWPTSIDFFTTSVGSATPLFRFSIASSGEWIETLDGLGLTTVDGGVIRNTAAATAGVAAQVSPRLRFSGQIWTGAASQTQDWTIHNLPGSGTAGALFFNYQNNTGGYTTQARLTSGGVFNVLTGFEIGGAAALGNVLRGDGTNFVAATTATLLADLKPSRYVGGVATAVNFNSANTDTAITIQLPAGATSYQVLSVKIANPSASLSTSTWGLFSATGGGGTAIFAAGQANTVTTAAANTNNNSMLAAPATAGTQAYNFATLQFRVGTAQGSAATANVMIEIAPIY
jgi:hypothetical protein